MRPIAGPEELELFCELPYVLNHELADDLERGHRRPEWMWMALRDGRLVARLAWWGRERQGPPLRLDVFDIDDDAPEGQRMVAGVNPLRSAIAHVVPAATAPPDYGRFVPPDWRSDAVSRRAVDERADALSRVGARLFVERLGLEWRPGTPLGRPSSRLRFRPVAGRDELVQLMARVLEGTLDAHSRRDMVGMTAEEAASLQYDDELAGYTTPGDWWRVATLDSGEPVGFVIPAHNGYNPIIAYVGVLPDHRGNGYIDDLLAEGTTVLASEDLPRIRASTDVGNVPMARAFQRAGWVVIRQELVMSWV